MAIDTPATIAVLGAGPLGLEASLYARYLGYQVDLYESGDLTEAVQRQTGRTLPGSFGENRSRLGLAALLAQDESFQPPDDEAVLTADEMLDAYWRPLADSDLVTDGLQFSTTVVAVVSRDVDNDDDEEDDEDEPGLTGPTTELLLTVRDVGGKERTESADVVIDTTGQFADNAGCLPNFYALADDPDAGEPASIATGLDRIRQTFAVVGG